MPDDPPRPLTLAVVVGALLVGLATLHLIRTRLVVGGPVGDRLERAARRANIALRVSDIAPAGLTGLRFEDVALRTQRRGNPLRLRADAVSIWPAYAALLEGRITPGRVLVSGAEIELGPGPDRTEAAPDRPSAPPDDTRSGAESRREANGAGPPLSPAFSAPDRLALAVEETEIELPPSGARRLGTVTLHRADATLRETAGRWRLTQLGGWGTLGGETAFSLSRESGQFPDGSADGPALVRASFRDRIRLDRAGELPMSGAATAEAIEICPRCVRRRACAVGPALEVGPLRATAGRACVERRERTIRAALSDLRFARDRSRLPVACTSAELILGPDFRPLEGSARCSDDRGGRLSFSGRRSTETGRARAELELSSFRLDGLWTAAGLAPDLRGGRADGRFELRGDPELSIASFDAELQVAGLTVSQSLVGRRALTFPDSSVMLAGTVDVDAGAVGVSDMTLRAGELSPVRLRGTAIRTAPGWHFGLEGRTEDVAAERLERTVPPALARPAAGADLSGDFDVGVSASGNTARPKSLTLEIDVDGDVDVLRESPNTPIGALASTGPVPDRIDHTPRRSPIDPADWVALETLPEKIPRTVVAAEDVDFYDHPGIDWSGIRNALVHNLRVGELERGGSTITQQLAKNLFLDRSRTLVRKLKELWVTWRLESTLPKDRILELYLNVVEWGPGVRGLRGAARHYFDVGPSELSVAQIALLSAILPGPHLYGRLIEGGLLPVSRVVKVEHILDNLRFLEIVDRETYRTLVARSHRGELGGLEFELCGTDPRSSIDRPPCAVD